MAFPFSRLPACLLLCACLPNDAATRTDDAPRPLDGPVSESPDGYTRIRSVHELPDGRVVLLDYLDRSLFALDLTNGTRAPVSRVGRGPGEYGSPSALHPFRGDSLVLVDGIRFGSVLVIDPRAHTLDMRRTGHDDTDQRLDSYRTAGDTIGHVYAQVALSYRVNGTPAIRLDSAAIERTDLRTQRRDTVARISTQRTAPGMTTATQSMGTQHQPFRARTIPFAVAEEWTALPDGTLAIVSPDPYRITFVDRDGTRTIGPELPVPVLPLSERHKEIWLEQDLRPKRLIEFTSGTPTPLNRIWPSSDPDWPPFLPPFVERGVHGAPDGTVWIQRTAPADSAPTIDVIGRDGHLVQRLALPLHTRLIGVSRTFVYLVRVDDDDLEYLQRWPRPS